MYRAFFVLRSIVEVCKITVALNMWLSSRIFLNKLELDLNDKNNREFIIDVVANALLTVMTFGWTFYRMW